MSFRYLLFAVTSLLPQLKKKLTFQKEKDYSYIDEEIAGLKTSTDVRKYWGQINRNDQIHRINKSTIVQQHGHGSKEHKELLDKIKEVDKENLIKAEKLLAKYGFPRGDSLGWAAASAAFTVILHAPEYETKEKYFPLIYKSYQRGDLKEGPVSTLLNQMYKEKMAKRYETGAVFNEQERINGIIEELGLRK